MLENMEFFDRQAIYFGIAGMLFWLIDYFKVFKKSEIQLPPTVNTQTGILNIGKWALAIVGIISWCFITYSLMGPREPMGRTNTQKEMNDIYFVVDVSRSMIAEDFPPNRIEAAKDRIREFVKLSPVDRIGIILFADQVYTQIPATTDLGLVERSIKDIRIGPLGSGTNIGDALGLAIARSTSSIAENKAVVLLTDGASNVGLLSPTQAAEKAKDLGIRIYTIGIGGDPNAQLPIGRDARGRKRYQQMPGGSMDFKTLEDIAKISGGRSFAAGNNEALSDVLSEIQKLEKRKIDIQGRVVYKELYWIYLVIGLSILLFVEVLRRFALREAY